MRMDINCSCALSSKCDVIWITPKFYDVLPNPVNGQPLVFYREVLLLSVAKTKDIETVVERDEEKRLSLLDRLSNDPGRVYAYSGLSI